MLECSGTINTNKNSNPSHYDDLRFVPVFTVKEIEKKTRIISGEAGPAPPCYGNSRGIN